MLTRARSQFLHSQSVFWAYLLLVTIAEFITFLVNPKAGMLMHAVLLLGFLLHGATGLPGNKFVLALTLAPLIRLLSLSLPLSHFPQLTWYPIVAIPLLVATAIIIRNLRLTRKELGLIPHKIGLQLMLSLSGVTIGVLEYLILRPEPVITDFSIKTFLIGGVILTLFTGFTEELIFRGIYQTLAPRILTRGALLYVSILFGVLHIGYLSFLDLLFVFLVGVLFAAFVHVTGSIFGVTLAHGLANITLFLAMPQVATLNRFAGNMEIVLLLAVSMVISTLGIYLALRPHQSTIIQFWKSHGGNRITETISHMREIRSQNSGG